MKVENTYLITQPIFGVRETHEGKKVIHHCSIINYGEDLGNGTIKYVTREGVQIQSIFNFESSISLVKFNSICLENLMSDWRRINKTYKPIVLDETIDTQEVFTNDFSPLKIMVERRKDCIAIKPIFDVM